MDSHGKTALKTVGSFVWFVTLLACLYSCTPVNKRLGLEDDNLIEESVEAVIGELIEDKTGYQIEIDLTPDDSDDDPNKIYPDAD